MFERFTDRARRVVVLAQNEARELKHNYIGTEHLILGILAESEGIAAQALHSFNISPELVRTQVETIIGMGQQAPAGHIPYTPRAKKVLELSLREALQLGHNYIGTEHILLGLIREGEGVAAQVLTGQGLELNAVRRKVIHLITGIDKKQDLNLQMWLKKVQTVTVYVLACSYCQENITGGTGYPNPEEAVAAAKEAGAVLTTLGGMSFNGPPVACTECQKRPLSEFRSEAS